MTYSLLLYKSETMDEVASFIKFHILRNICCTFDSANNKAQEENLYELWEEKVIKGRRREKSNLRISVNEKVRKCCIKSNINEQYW